MNVSKVCAKPRTLTSRYLKNGIKEVMFYVPKRARTTLLKAALGNDVSAITVKAPESIPNKTVKRDILNFAAKKNFLGLCELLLKMNKGV